MFRSKCSSTLGGDQAKHLRAGADARTTFTGPLLPGSFTHHALVINASRARAGYEVRNCGCHMTYIICYHLQRITGRAKKQPESASILRFANNKSDSKDNRMTDAAPQRKETFKLQVEPDVPHTNQPPLSPKAESAMMVTHSLVDFHDLRPGSNTVLDFQQRVHQLLLQCIAGSHSQAGLLLTFRHVIRRCQPLRQHSV